MDSNLITAIVTAIASAGSSTTVAIVAIMQTNKRIDDLNAHFSGRLDRIERRLDTIEQHLGAFAVDIARLKERTGLE